jgi:hypothetical protein
MPDKHVRQDDLRKEHNKKQRARVGWASTHSPPVQPLCADFMSGMLGTSMRTENIAANRCNGHYPTLGLLEARWRLLEATFALAATLPDPATTRTGRMEFNAARSV